MKRFDRKTEILTMLSFARDALDSAPLWDEARTRRAFTELAQEWLDKARTMMAEAPASSRRRWKASAVINARKRRARKAMEPFVVLYRDPKARPADPPRAFECMAANADHAEEQCARVHPGRPIAWVYAGRQVAEAFNNYFKG